MQAPLVRGRGRGEAVMSCLSRRCWPDGTAPWHSAPHREHAARPPALRCCTAPHCGPGAGADGPAALCGPVVVGAFSECAEGERARPDSLARVSARPADERPDAWDSSMPPAVAAVADARRLRGAPGVTGDGRRLAAERDETPAAGDAPAGQPCARGSGRGRLRVKRACRPCTRPAAHWPGLRLLQADGCRAEPPPPAT
jgi:hypothetical protein